MTPEQFDRWRDFSRRLALHGWPEATEARKNRIEIEVDNFIAQMEPWKDEINDWDGNGGFYLCDEMTRYLDEEFPGRKSHDDHTRFQDQISACVRSGIDVAVCPSAGVWGFTVGTLRLMYDGTVPDWLVNFFEPPLPADADDNESVWL